MKFIKVNALYIICLSLILISLLSSTLIYEKYKNSEKVDLKNNITDYKEEKYTNNRNVSISYPKFNIENIDKKIKNITTLYKNKSNVKITYDVYINGEILNVFFEINDNDKFNYNNIVIDIKENKIIENFIDLNIYKDIILERVKYKYKTNIYESIVRDNFSNMSYKITDEGIYFYFNDSLFENLIYKVYVFLANENTKEVFEENYDKVIAFTFDDGPSNYTMEIVNALVLNNSKATFFELGNRMKYNQEIVKNVLNNKMEIGSHTYAHKNLNKLSESELDEEINSTNIIFNEITGENIKLLRPPYGNTNEFVRSRVNTPIITWSIDTNDWLYKDSEYVYNHIITNVQDGDIILMHDIYPETVEAVKKVLPYLVQIGYKVTTVSELAEIKNITLENGVIYRNIKSE